MEQIWQLLLQNGITTAELGYIKNVYLVLLMIPIITTILAIFRYIIGIKSPNIFAVLILTFAFMEFGFQGNLDSNFLQGLKYASLLYFIVFITATLCYAAIRRFRMHYIPKMSIVFTAVVFAYILLIFVLRSFESAPLLITNTFVLVALATLAENVVTSIARKDLRYSIDLSARTYIISVLCFFVISIDALRNLLLNYPYLMIVLIVLNIYIGKFKGLRITEYFRFKSLLLSDNNEPVKSNTKK